MTQNQVQYHASRFISVTWDDGIIFAENHYRGTRARISRRSLDLLHVLQRPRRLAELQAYLTDWSEEDLLQALNTFVSASFVYTEAEPIRQEAAVADAWRPWTPLAIAFHYGTRDINFVSGPDAQDYFTAVRDEQPSSFKVFPDAPKVALTPTPFLDADLKALLLSRRSIREFSDSPIHLEQISAILRYTYGRIGWIDLPIIGRLPLKTSPSGGGRHPIEVYVIARCIEGLRPGVYHYSVLNDELEHLDEAPTHELLIQAFPGQYWVTKAAALMVMTGVVARSMWKYRFARAYRVMHIDAGHLGQTFFLIATSLGLAPGVTGAFNDSCLERIIGSDGPREPALYVATIGRPRQHT